jgi:hypothetical protein
MLILDNSFLLHHLINRQTVTIITTCRNCDKIITDVQTEKWFDPAFQEFITNELVMFYYYIERVVEKQYY